MSTKETDYSDSDLINGIYMRDERIVSAIIKLMRPSVARLVYAKGGNKEDVHYIIEEVIVIIYTKTEKSVLTSSFKTFFIGIAKKVWYNEFRRRTRGPQHTDLENIDLPIEENNPEIALLRRNLVLKHFALLPYQCQEILKMVAFGYSNEDIMERMEFSSIQYTKNRKLACYNKLVEILKKDPLFAELAHTD